MGERSDVRLVGLQEAPYPNHRRAWVDSSSGSSRGASARPLGRAVREVPAESGVDSWRRMASSPFSSGDAGAGPTAHFIIGAAILNGDAATLASTETWAIRLEAVRRVGVVLYLVAIALGLTSIAEVLRFQATRVRELPAEASH